MRKTLLIALVLNIFFATANCGAQTETKVAKRSILIVYFSRVGTSQAFTDEDAVSSASLPEGNTIVIANMIHDMVGGDLFQIVTAKPYPAAYRDTTDEAQTEQRQNARPKLSTHVTNMAKYDVIFLGYPNWWGTIPMPLFTFLEEYDLTGKTIIPFCTHEGSGLGGSEKDIAKLCPKAKIADGLAVRGSSANGAKVTVKKWLTKLGY